jgi:hypothetical protein
LYAREDFLKRKFLIANNECAGHNKGANAAFVGCPDQGDQMSLLKMAHNVAQKVAQSIFVIFNMQLLPW